MSAIQHVMFVWSAKSHWGVLAGSEWLSQDTWLMWMGSTAEERERHFWIILWKMPEPSVFFSALLQSCIITHSQHEYWICCQYHLLAISIGKKTETELKLHWTELCKTGLKSQSGGVVMPLAFTNTVYTYSWHLCNNQSGPHKGMILATYLAISWMLENCLNGIGHPHLYSLSSMS